MKKLGILFLATGAITCFLAIMSNVFYNTDSSEMTRLHKAIDKCVISGGYIDHAEGEDGWIYFCSNGTYKLNYK